VFEWLGLPPARISPGYEKLAVRSPRDQVENYPALAMHFATTRWAELFEPNRPLESGR
jgi:hypothetical protein